MSEDTNFTDYIETPEAGVEAEAPETGDVNWEERYRAEVQDRIKERERYKPIKQVFDQMHPDDAAAVAGFAQAWASGDQDTAVQWMIENAKTLAGEKFAEIAGVTPQQQQTIIQESIEDGQQAGLTPEQVEKLVEQRMAAFQHDQIVAQYEQEITETLREAGYDPESPLAVAAIAAAQNRPDLDLRAAISDIENQILTQAQAIVSRRQNPSAGMPPASPNGIPAQGFSNMSPRERAMARLEGNSI